MQGCRLSIIALSLALAGSITRGSPPTAPSGDLRSLSAAALYDLAMHGERRERLAALDESVRRWDDPALRSTVEFHTFRAAMDDPAADVCRAAAYALWCCGEAGAAEWVDAARSRDIIVRIAQDAQRALAR